MSDVITVYEKPSCTKCREVDRLLRESGVSFDKVNYYIEPLSEKKLRDLIKRMGKCPDCGEWNSFVEEHARAVPKRETGRASFRLKEIRPIAYGSIESQDDVRITSGVAEFDRVLGGGIVPGSLILIGGEPGIGKSTLLLDVADKLSASGESVLYVSGEESERQIKLRGERLGVHAQNLFLLPETNLENIFGEIEKMNPGAVIVDSIQTVFSEKIESAPGSVSQVREVAGQFLLLAKNRTIP